MNLQNFKDREKERKELHRVLESDRFEFVIIYGRRRIGKTELILKATENSKRIYYLAVGKANLMRFYTQCIRKYPEISKLRPDWEILFEFLKNRQCIVIIDEFQNMIQEDESILNIFQSITDTILKESKTKLFLLGSSISILTSKVLDYKSPLYGRRTGSMELKAVGFFEAGKFFKERDANELMDIYSFADGIPFYLVKIEGPFWPWLTGEIKKETGFLKDEVDFLLRYEFEDAGTYKLILEAVAHGKTKINEIKDYIKVKRTDISPYISNLLEVKMLKRTVPVTENIKSRKGRYYISDNFLKFWFRYIYPNLSAIEEGVFDANIIKTDYTTYQGRVFEDVSRQFLIRKNIFPFTKIGQWWHKEREIDIVALNADTKEVLFCECKWRENVNAGKTLKELKEKAQYVQWNNGARKEHYAIFAKSFKEKIKEPDVMLFDMDDIKK